MISYVSVLIRHSPARHVTRSYTISAVDKKALIKEGTDHLLHTLLLTMFVGYVTSFDQPVMASWKD